MARRFLHAHWSNLVLLNYAVPDELLTPLLPKGLELDRWQGSAYISLVAFQFLRTRVLGIAVPGLVNFPEINLRFYVRDASGRRGVMFIREYVPSRLIGLVARTVYNEPYASAPMSMAASDDGGQRHLRYTIGRAGERGTITATVQRSPWMPAGNSLEHHFKEHQWGFGVSRSGRTLVYQVRHRAWQCFPVEACSAELDWSSLYGERWGSLAQAKPDSIVIAEGSEVEVFICGHA